MEHNLDGLSDENKTVVGVLERREIVSDGLRVDDEQDELDVKERLYNGLFESNKIVVSGSTAERVSLRG